MIIILIIASIVSAIVSKMQGENDYIDSIIIIVIVVLNALMGLIQETKAEKSIEALKNMTAPMAKVRRNGKIEEVSSKEIVPGDIVVFIPVSTTTASACPFTTMVLENAILFISPIGIFSSRTSFEFLFAGSVSPVSADSSIFKLKLDINLQSAGT